MPSLSKIVRKLFSSPKSDLDKVIPSEINQDQFAEALDAAAALDNIKTIIEIGSSSGTGSTAALIRGALKHPNTEDLQIACLEMSKPRFANLKDYLSTYPFATAFNVSSVPAKSFPTLEELHDFYHNSGSNLSKFSLKEVTRWYHQDLEYMANSKVPENGIEVVKESFGVEVFDMCVIDGSEFTGKAELEQLIGSKHIFLDDTETFKCFEAKRVLDENPDYDLVQYVPDLRNGFAYFVHR